MSSGACSLCADIYSSGNFWNRRSEIRPCPERTSRSSYEIWCTSVHSTALRGWSALNGQKMLLIDTKPASARAWICLTRIDAHWDAQRDRLDDAVVSAVGQEPAYCLPAERYGNHLLRERVGIPDEGRKGRTGWSRMSCWGVHGARSPFP